MDFATSLTEKGFYYQPECGAYVRESDNGFLMSYVQDDDVANLWNCEVYDSLDKLIDSYQLVAV